MDIQYPGFSTQGSVSNANQVGSQMNDLISRVSCQKALSAMRKSMEVRPFWQDTIDIQCLLSTGSTCQTDDIDIQCLGFFTQDSVSNANQLS